MSDPHPWIKGSEIVYKCRTKKCVFLMISLFRLESPDVEISAEQLSYLNNIFQQQQQPGKCIQNVQYLWSYSLSIGTAIHMVTMDKISWT